MKPQRRSPSPGRRLFLQRMLGAAGGLLAGGAAVSAAGRQPSAATPPQATPEPAVGYRETDHVRAYYRSARP